jgi:hypothetical protein
MDLSPVPDAEAEIEMRVNRCKDAAMTLIVLSLLLGAELLWFAGLFLTMRDPDL